LDKIRFLSLTVKSALAATEEMSIKIKADKDNNVLHVTDTGIGMTKEELVKNLGTIAKSGTSEFLSKLQVCNIAFVAEFYRLLMIINISNFHVDMIKCTLHPGYAYLNTYLA
jgi:HSP90 family molecular chaperone